MAKELIYKFKMPIGDWSDDGHGKYNLFFFVSNYPVIDLQNAYKESCRKTRVQFNHNQNYTGIENLAKWGTDRHICCELDDCSLSDTAIEALGKYNISTKEFEEDNNVDNFVNMLISFISISMPDDFMYEEASVKRSEIKDIIPLNGYCNSQLNCQFGYGLYD